LLSKRKPVTGTGFTLVREAIRIAVDFAPVEDEVLIAIERDLEKTKDTEV